MKDGRRRTEDGGRRTYDEGQQTTDNAHGREVMGKVLFEVDGGVAKLTLNRPERSNALDDEMTRELMDVLKQVERNEAVRAVVVTGAGKNFCAGQDLAAFLERRNAPDAVTVREHLVNGYNKVIWKIRTIEKPFIAAV